MFAGLLSIPSSPALSYGASKLAQIFVPLTAFIIFRELPIRQQLMRKLAHTLHPGLSIQNEQILILNYDSIFDRALGFMTWKIGCDFGFFIVATGIGTWDRAFTWAGLIPYTLVQYGVYHLVGQRMIIEGRLHPFAPAPIPTPTLGRPPLWRQIVSKYLHENMNMTSYNVPLRQVFLKPFVDYLGIVTSWSCYTVGILYLQSGEINFSPLVHFAFLQMLAFYVINTFGFILGYNLGEIIYLRILELEESIDYWSRQQPPGQLSLGTLWISLKNSVNQISALFLWRITPFLNRYGLSLRWLFCSILGVLFVIYLEPGFADVVFALSSRIQQFWFSHFGHLDPLHLNQVTAASSLQDMQSSDELLEEFPRLWNRLFFGQEEV
jgi:hypothetical protein